MFFPISVIWYFFPFSGKILYILIQEDCELVKIDIHCHIQGDVVLECISLEEDMEREEMMFRVMFNTAFIRSNILMLNRDEIDILWNSKDQFPKDFRAEVSLSLSLSPWIYMSSASAILFCSCFYFGEGSIFGDGFG